MRNVIPAERAGARESRNPDEVSESGFPPFGFAQDMLSRE